MSSAHRTPAAAPAASSLTLLSGPGRWLASFYILLVALLMTSAGWMALREGATTHLQPFQMAESSNFKAHQASELRAQPTQDNLDKFSNELGLLAMWTSPQRFIDSQLIEQALYYIQMPRLNQILLASHIFLSVFCMLFGGLQFWPLFRKRFMRAHRLIGAGYIATAPISVLLSFAYMAVTPPHLLYTGLTGYVALWLFGLLAIGSIVMAVLSLKRKRIHEHMAYMALSFACLLIAPMLRWNWVGLAWLFPHIDQETHKLVSITIMLPEVLVIGYGLILANRQYARPMTRRPMAAIAQRASGFFQSLSPLLYLTAAGFTAINVLHYVFGHGMSTASAAANLIPAALLAREGAIMNQSTGLSSVFGLSVSLALLTGLHLLHRLLAPNFNVADVRTEARAWVVLALTAGISATMLGWQIGLSKQQLWLSGGAAYTTAGLLITTLSVLFAGALQSKHWAMMKEFLVMALSALPFTAMFFIILWCLQWMPIPTDYIQAGQGYILSAGGGTALMFLAMFYVVYGQATREHG
jgi:hypothetical protein